MKIALDAMGGDLAPQATVQGAMAALKLSNNDFEIILVGDENQINAELGNHLPGGISIHHASDIVTMHDDGCKAIWEPSVEG